MQLRRKGFLKYLFVFIYKRIAKNRKEEAVLESFTFSKVAVISLTIMEPAEERILRR